MRNHLQSKPKSSEQVSNTIFPLPSLKKVRNQRGPVGKEEEEGQWEELVVEQEWVRSREPPNVKLVGALVIENVAMTCPQRKDHQESSTLGQEAPKYQEQVYQVVAVQVVVQAVQVVPQLAVIAGDMKDTEAAVEP